VRPTTVSHLLTGALTDGLVRDASNRMGTVAGSIDSILTAKEIVDEMVTTAKESIQTVGAMAKL
jgi:NAD(P)H-dependent flavin oxidoreductase YrpB (nitropropane dioxygenase family)